MTLERWGSASVVGSGVAEVCRLAPLSSSRIEPSRMFRSFSLEVHVLSPQNPGWVGHIFQVLMIGRFRRVRVCPKILPNRRSLASLGRR